MQRSARRTKGGEKRVNANRKLTAANWTLQNLKVCLLCLRSKSPTHSDPYQMAYLWCCRNHLRRGISKTSMVCNAFSWWWCLQIKASWSVRRMKQKKVNVPFPQIGSLIRQTSSIRMLLVPVTDSISACSLAGRSILLLSIAGLTSFHP